MIPAIIIDDEQHCINHLVKLLKDYYQDIFVCGMFKSVDDGIEGILNLKPQLLFLDIQIGTDNAFNLLNRIKNRNFEVIFTTAFDRFAVQAIKCSALDYLLKPIDREELQWAIKKMQQRQPDQQYGEQISTLLHNLKTVNQNNQRICVPVLNGLTFLNVSEIVRLKSDSNYTQIFMKDGKTMMVSKTLKEFDELLSAQNFFRVHQSHLINLAFISQYTKGQGGFVTMTDGSEIEVSIRKKEAFLKLVLNR
ncbi:MAG: LytTR family DNA-binding domain-containing protein [Bacteroidia bacterium]|nr:response regulator transcription factor [Bacteroidia bacterium]MCZ2276847.1 LytTR family DNA-binding domain-containing protein [Bacteroidia bacterium]